jgi:hypothetical protein
MSKGRLRLVARCREHGAPFDRVAQATRHRRDDGLKEQAMQAHGMRVMGRGLCGAALVVAIGPPAVAGATDRAAAPDAAVAAHDSFYVWGGAAFEDLDRLEAAVAQHAPTRLVLNACGAGAAWPLMAAAHRLGAVPLELRVRDLDAAECRVPARATPVGATARPRGAPAGIDAAAVTEWWRRREP